VRAPGLERRPAEADVVADVADAIDLPQRVGRLLLDEQQIERLDQLVEQPCDALSDALDDMFLIFKPVIEVAGDLPEVRVRGLAVGIAGGVGATCRLLGGILGAGRKETRAAGDALAVGGTINGHGAL
jgi:hypothetical protein